MEFTTTQRQTLDRWFSAYHDQFEEFDFPIQFTRVLAGDKPATLLQRSDLTVDGGPFFFDDGAVSFVNELGLVTTKRDKSWFCARSQAQFELLSSAEMGKFYGYPEKDIKWFVDTPPDERVSAKERADNGDFTPEQLAYVDFTPYVNEDSIEGYKRAIEDGKRIRDLLSDIADEWRLPVLDQLADDHYQLSVEVYSGERDHFPGEGSPTIKMTFKNPNLD